MIVSQNQRYRDRRDSYRPARETINPRDYEVAAIPDDTTAKGFVVAHHYSRCFPAARFRVGLYRRSELVGVAVFSMPCSAQVLDALPCRDQGGVELGRFVLLDDVPGNGETWFLARAFALLRREGYAGVLSFSDPHPRATAAGHVVFPGHIGTIYQAGNAVYLGRGSARTLRVLPDGTVFSARAISKVRAKERGWRYAAGILERAGAAPPGSDLRAWLREWLPRLTRTVRHPGMHLYAWGLERAVSRLLPPSQPYPKKAA